MMKKLMIDQELCTGCGECADVLNDCCGHLERDGYILISPRSQRLYGDMIQRAITGCRREALSLMDVID